MKRRVGVLISGRGSNMLALLDAADGDLSAEIVLVASDNPAAPGLTAAAARGVPVAAVDRRAYRERAAHEVALVEHLDAAGCEIVCLAGYMRILTPFLVGRYAGRMLNIHPSLLPAFPGLHTHARALQAGVRLHGCTVHLVTDALDAGPILAQAAVPVLPDDTPDTLAARVLTQEHKLYPAALAAFLGGGAALPRPESALCNPLPLPLLPA